MDKSLSQDKSKLICTKLKYLRFFNTVRFVNLRSYKSAFLTALDGVMISIPLTAVVDPFKLG